MNILMVTENEFQGKVDRTWRNLRTEFGWMLMMDATHMSWKTFMERCISSDTVVHTGTGVIDVSWENEMRERMKVFDNDLILFIIPKTKPETIAFIRGFVIPNKKHMIGIIQEGEFEYFQNLDVKWQMEYLETLDSVDLILCHNEVDKLKFEAICACKNVLPIPTCFFTKKYKPLDRHSNNSIMIHGTCTQDYNGSVGLAIAKDIGFDEYAMPGMGRRRPDQESAPCKTLPYMQLDDWMEELKNYKYAINMTNQVAAGSCIVNSACVGTVCVGCDQFDTQMKLFPMLSFPMGEYGKAKELLRRLRDEAGFYESCLEGLDVRLKEVDIDVQGPVLMAKLESIYLAFSL